ncbi:MAG: hypothetical protein VKP62_00710 [Candidatus Sericytochromatia bacterium]|nr:hypothetical protein [Candidatus Sericytochromatia bacterium]
MAFLSCWRGIVAGPLLVAGVLGCTANAVNTATLYKPVRGVIELAVVVPSGEAVERVQFQLNDEVVAEDTNGADGFSAEIDTSGLPPDVLAKLAAVGVRTDGTVVVLRENFILIDPRVVAVASVTPAASGTVTPNGTASGTR